jgi:DNA-directed RNA polymerase specialized sigma24 family protein
MCTTTEAEIDIENNDMFSNVDPGMKYGSITRYEINDALSMLPIEHKMLVVLCDVQGFTCHEAAKVLKCSSISVRVRLGRARKRLRALLSQALDEVE